MNWWESQKDNSKEESKIVPEPYKPDPAWLTFTLKYIITPAIWGLLITYGIIWYVLHIPKAIINGLKAHRQYILTQPELMFKNNYYLTLLVVVMLLPVVSIWLGIVYILDFIFAILGKVEKLFRKKIRTLPI